MPNKITLLVLFGTIVFPFLAHGEIQARPTQLSAHEIQLVEWVQTNQSALLADLQTYVKHQYWHV